jgi:hypothetical protein
MVAVTQAVPSNGHLVHVHPVDPSSSLILFDVSIYLVRHIRSFVNGPAGDTIFDPALGLLPRWAVATFYALYGGVAVYTNVDMLYHVTTLVRRVVLWQSASSGLRFPIAHGRPHQSQMSGASTGTSSPARVRRLQRTTGRVLGDRRIHDLRMRGLGWGRRSAPSAGSSSWASGRLRSMRSGG